MTRLLALLLVSVLAPSLAVASDDLPQQAVLARRPAIEGSHAGAEQPVIAVAPESPAKRPLSFSLLYGANAALQGFDAYSTLKAIDDHGTERNPMMKSVAGSPAGFLAIKAGAATIAIVAAERLRTRNHRVAAILLMLGSNGFMTYVALNNARALGRR